jgi:DNA-binding beta-propeller fold protein YncE
MYRPTHSAVVLALSTALGLSGISFALADTAPKGDNKDLVLITNTDGSISLIKRDPRNKEEPYFEAEKVDAGLAGAAWPANQYIGSTDWWWTGQSNGSVEGFEFRRADPLQAMVESDRRINVDTYITPGRPDNGANFAGVTPDGKTLWNAAREVDEIQEIDADPDSPTFGQILTRIDVPYSAFASELTPSRGAMRPCDMSITPDGTFLFEPDLGGETVTAVDIHSREVVGQIVLDPLEGNESTRPFMLTTNGQIALVENQDGTYSVIDVTDPYNMHEEKRLTQDDGVGVSPQTSEFTPDGKYAYLIANGSPSVPGVISVLELTTLTIPKQITLPPGCRPHAGDFSRDGRHFFVNCSGASSVAVIDTKTQELVQNVALADNVTPRGVLNR